MSRQQEERKELVNKVVQQMKDGRPFFWEPGHDQRLMNAATGRSYRGGNALKLTVAAIERGYTDPRWCTFNQAKANGWKVRKGEHGVKIEVWRFPEKKDKTAEKEDISKEETDNKKPLDPRRPYRVDMPTVFNVEQMDGVPQLPELTPEHKAQIEKERIAAIETIIAHSEAPVRQDQLTNNYYSPKEDAIHVMKKEKFHHADDFYSTVLHEIGHSTGHETRLKRNMKGMFGSPDYAKEELRAELTSMFLNQEFNMRFSEDHFQHHAAYLQGWAKALADDPNELYRAASDADKAVQYIHEHMLDRYLDLHKEQVATKKLELSPLENMSQKELDAYGEKLKGARDYEVWRMRDTLPRSVVKAYTDFSDPKDWESLRNKACDIAAKCGDIAQYTPQEILEKIAVPIVLESQKSWLTETQERIRQLKEAYPIQKEEPYVQIQFSEELPDSSKEKPLEWPEGLDLSITAAEHLFKETDAKRYLTNALTGRIGTYGKTAYAIVDEQNSELWDDRYDMGVLNGGLSASIKGDDQKLDARLKELVELQEKRLEKPLAVQKMPQLEHPKPMDVEETLRLADIAFPKQDAKPSISLVHEQGQNTVSVQAAQAALTYLNEKQADENKMSRWLANGQSKSMGVEYTMQNAKGEVLGSGTYILGDEKTSFADSVKAKYPDLTVVLEEKRTAQKPEKERQLHNISRTIELKPKRRRKAVVSRRKPAEKGRSR